jgi:hypothetical protein
MPKEVKLHIADGDIVSWGPINNTFAWKPKLTSWERPRDHWNGMVIALGNYDEFNGSKDRTLFASVQFRNAGGECIRTLLPGRFSVINILADPSERSDPVPLGMMSKIPSLERDSFHPFAWITYWHDWGGYDITVREHYIASRLSLSYVFAFREVGQIRVVNDGVQETLDLNDVSSVLVNAVRKGKGPLGDKNDPPPRVP